MSALAPSEPNVAPSNPPAPIKANMRLAWPTSSTSPSSSQNCTMTTVANKPVHT
jgi:hypothetical protein